MVYYRLFSVEKEHFQIVEDLPKTKVKVVIPGSTNSDINSSNIEEYYLKLLEEIPLLRLPYLWDVVAITGKNNIELTTTFLERVWDLKPMANSELNQSITEISQATSQILKSAAALETNCLAKKSIGNPEKSNKTSNSKIIAMSSTKTEGKELMKQLQFLLSFSVDIVYSLSVVLKAGKNFLPKTAIFVLNGTQLGKPQGTMLIQVILHFYEIILPILMKILGEVFTTTSRNDRESLQKLVDLHKLAVVLGSSCIEVHYIFYYTRKKYRVYNSTFLLPSS